MKYLYSLVLLSFWSVLIFINIKMAFNNEYLAIMKASYNKYFNGQMVFEFPLVCAVLHMFFGYLVAFPFIITIRSKKWAVLIFFVMLLIGTTLAFLNYLLFDHILYVI